MMNKVIIDPNLNAGLKKVPQETWQRNLNHHAKGLNNMEETVQDAHSKMGPAIYKRSSEVEQAK
jgi:hypothetical protein